MEDFSTYQDYDVQFDVNQDGVEDAYTVSEDADGSLIIESDVDGDGANDFVGVDSDADGDIDAANVDTDGDGYDDKTLDDVDGDGRADTVTADTDGDGTYDTASVDDDGDGRPQRRLPRRTDDRRDAPPADRWSGRPAGRPCQPPHRPGAVPHPDPCSVRGPQ